MATGAAYGIDRQTRVVHRVACDRYQNLGRGRALFLGRFPTPTGALMTAWNIGYYRARICAACDYLVADEIFRTRRRR